MSYIYYQTGCVVSILEVNKEAYKKRTSIICCYHSACIRHGIAKLYGITSIIKCYNYLILCVLHSYVELVHHEVPGKCKGSR